jgi:hypothetical protein
VGVRKLQSNDILTSFRTLHIHILNNKTAKQLYFIYSSGFGPLFIVFIVIRLLISNRAVNIHFRTLINEEPGVRLSH